MRLRAAAAAVAGCAMVCAGAEPSRVFLMSFDGLGQQMIASDPARAELRTLRGLMRTSAHAAGLRAAFPSTTANSHAALWTGTYAGRNGVLANRNPMAPRSEHAFTERRNGFRSEGLEAEPLWVAAARQGVSVVAHQVTQAYPFLPQSVGEKPYPAFNVANSYQSQSFSPWRVLRPSDVKTSSCDRWAGVVRDARTCSEWTLPNGAGDTPVYMAMGAGAVYVAFDPGSGWVQVERREAEKASPRGRALGRYWSKPLAVPGLPRGIAASVVYRLFELDSATGEFVLLQGPVQEMALYGTGREDLEAVRRLIAEAGPAAGNGAHGLYVNGDLGAMAEDRYLETVEWVVRQQIAHSTWLNRNRRARLHITYLPFPDETDHTWLGFGDRFVEQRKRAYALVDVAAAAFLGMAGKRDHVVVTSDHGMAPVRKAVAVQAALERDGLGDVAATAGTCILVNSTDWKGGVVPAAERPAVVQRIVQALKAVKDSGVAVVTKTYAMGSGLEQFGLGRQADVCFDLAPGYGVSEAAAGDLVQPLKRPKGEHGFDPLRADMQAVLMVRGPRVRRDRWPLLPSSVVAPLGCDLLGIGAPSSSEGRSPLEGR